MHTPSPSRYSDSSIYKRCGRSGLKLSRLSLGLWHNFGDNVFFENARTLVLHAFDKGITHFDLANNYGPPPGSAETNFGRILREELAAHRDELIISTKAGYLMWDGPYGEWGGRKYMLASLDQSLKRLGLDYVDIFYSHRFDPETPLEETMGALAHAVRSGKALYAGLSNYNPDQTARAAAILRDLGTPCLIHQPKYHMYERTPEHGLLDVLAREGIGCIPFCPLAQGLLTDRYLNGIPADSRAAHDPRFLKPEDITEAKLAQLRALNEMAKARGQSLAQLALAWVLRQPVVTTALIGASKTKQIDDNLGALKNTDFSDAEIASIDKILAS
ncbi:L-glyceraldehyde 3-phosphate reductase [Ereboglobus luteus]|uniref:L-glyceraldehyde 3-phosphate reductase n=1 Tax=Ereboglobus luteus TaxID=1796921 RepID=A0A2U8E5I3_9BACT|nr:L-glyceraldehyde 3-phosphate reductase [Ereboglobus luteus]AWI09782.1 L-glyceraldehyde 3-phosphate reductase [Ereboglobus luteus]